MRVHQSYLVNYYLIRSRTKIEITLVKWEETAYKRRTAEILLTNNTAIFWEGKSMYNQIEDILLNISIVIATVWIVKDLGSFLKKSRIVYFLFPLWIVYCIFQFFLWLS